MDLASWEALPEYIGQAHNQGPVLKADTEARMFGICSLQDLIFNCSIGIIEV